MSKSVGVGCAECKKCSCVFAICRGLFLERENKIFMRSPPCFGPTLFPGLSDWGLMARRFALDRAENGDQTLRL